MSNGSLLIQPERCFYHRSQQSPGIAVTTDWPIFATNPDMMSPGLNGTIPAGQTVIAVGSPKADFALMNVTASVGALLQLRISQELGFTTSDLLFSVAVAAGGNFPIWTVLNVALAGTQARELTIPANFWHLRLVNGATAQVDVRMYIRAGGL